MTPIKRRARLLIKDKNGEISAFHGKKPVGGINYVLVPGIRGEKSQARISVLGVDEEHQRKGIATQLFENLEKKVDEVVVLDIKPNTILAKMLIQRGYKIRKDEEGYWAIKEKK